MKLTWKEKRMIESTMEGQILAHPNGINTRTLITNVQNILSNTIPNQDKPEKFFCISSTFQVQ